jgi:hypothetical protein
MKEVKILAWCDSCAADDRREAATDSATVTLGPRGKPLTLDLCDTCHEAMIQPLSALLAEYGQNETGAIDKPVVVSTPKASSGRERSTCPICSVTRSAAWPLAAHVWRDHLGKERPPALRTCPDCDFAPPADSRKPAAATGRHRANVHGYDPLAEALALYRQKTGDVPERKPA